MDGILLQRVNCGHELLHRSWNTESQEGESSSMGAQVREKIWNSEELKSSCSKTSPLHSPRKQNGKTPQCTQSPEPGAAPGKPPCRGRVCAGTQESQNLFPGVSCGIQHSTKALNEREKEQEKQQQHEKGHEMCVGCSTVSAPPNQPQSRAMGRHWYL